MQIESGVNKDPKCLLSAAGFWMSTMEFVFGPVPIDNTRSAKIGLQASLREIAAMEEELRGELEALIGRLKVTQKQTKNMERIKPTLIQCRKIKNRLAVLERKKEALQNHVETIENSELNQHVLHSMQRTSSALKAMGLDKSLQSVDKVMLDLEENHSDMNSLQQTLCVSYTEEEDVDWGQELSMLLNDDCMSIPVVRNTMPAVREEQPASAPAEVTLEVVPAPSQQGGSAAEDTVKKTEPAVMQEVVSA
jgi:myosin heavy subunit